MGFLSEEDVNQAREQLLTGCAVMEKSLQTLHESDGCVATQIHAIRKLGKSLRGGFTLFRLEKSSAKEIQTIGRLLSESRDAVSRYKTWSQIGWAQETEAKSAINSLLALQSHSAAQRPPAETITWCIQRVTAARNLLSELSAEELPDRLALGLKKLSKQVNKRCLAIENRNEQSFHDVRKALKAYLGALTYLPEKSTPLDPEMSELVSLLGDENDLTTLAEWLKKHGFSEQFTPNLWRQLKSVRISLRKKAMPAVKRLRHPSAVALL
jgi:CHAD domain